MYIMHVEMGIKFWVANFMRSNQKLSMCNFPKSPSWTKNNTLYVLYWVLKLSRMFLFLAPFFYIKGGGRLDHALCRCLELEIWWFSWWQRTDKTNCFTPCVCARGNYSQCIAHYSYVLGVKVWSCEYKSTILPFMMVKLSTTNNIQYVSTCNSL